MQKPLVVLVLGALLAAFAASAQSSPSARQAAPNVSPPPPQSAAPASELTHYEAAVRDRVAYYQTRFDALDKLSNRIGKNEKQAFQKAMKSAKDEIAAVRSMQGRLQSAKAEEWGAAHDAIESSFHDVGRTYGRMLVQLPDDVVASVFPYSTSSETRARAAETTRPGLGGAPKSVDLSTLRTDTPYAAHVRERLQRIDTKLSALDSAVAASSSQAQERGREITTEIRGRMKNIVADAGRLANASGKEQWTHLHDGIEAGFDDVLGAFALATETLERDRAGAAANPSMMRDGKR